MASPQEPKAGPPRGVRGASRSPVTPACNTGKPRKKAASPQASQSLQEVKKRGHRMKHPPDKQLCEQLEGLNLLAEAAVQGTGLVYDEQMAHTYCLWDQNFPECPGRIWAVRDKMAEYGLAERCVAVPAREASEEEISLIHSPQYVALMRSTQKMTTDELRALSDRYDSVYLHPTSFTCASLAVGSVLQLVDRVQHGEIRNGLAVVRPPGHHAHADQMNGYCMFNQLAIAARYAQLKYGAKRVLIVDWDVHHGQGTQFIFESDPSVLYFSVHRYDNGGFWPHLKESTSSAVGKERGERFNVNVAWNKTRMSDADYIHVFLNVLLPVAYEFQPHLVLVAAGFDSVVGDPKGEMSATPACFSHLTHLLMSLAQGRLILSLEGGYNQRSLAEGACASLKALLGDPCPRLTLPSAPCQSALDSMSDTISAHCSLWKMLQDYDSEGEPSKEPQSADEVPPEGIDELPLEKCLEQTMIEVMRKVPEQRTVLVYDEQMMEHHNMWDCYHPESPQRINQIFKRHKDLGLLDRCSRLPSRLATQKELQMCHSLSYIQKIEASSHMKPRDLHRLGDEYNSIYINSRSYHSAQLAAGSTFNVVEAVVTGKAQNGICIVRPPGHHAEPGEACGFCFFNTVALAARYAQRLQSRSEDLLRVMILDWDVHHGNGTQHIFQEDASVLYMSLHRYDEGLFFPNSEDASHDKVGIGKGAGYNVNIPWNGGKMGDVEYLMAFHRVVMPIAYEFNPQLVLISAGFDAARGDPLGGCQVSPEGYAHLTHLLMGLAGGRVILVLEGGYNLTSISESMVMCTRSLLGDPPPALSDLRPPKSSALNSVCKVRQAHRKYWRSLRLNVVGPPPKSAQGAKNLQHSPMRNSPRKGRFAAEAGPLTESKISPQGASSPKKIPSEVTVAPLSSPLSSFSIEETPIPLTPDSKFSPEEVADQFVSAETAVQLAAPQYKMSKEEVANKLASPQGLTSLESTISQLVSNREEIAPAWEHETPKSPPIADSQKVPMGELVAAAEDIADALLERGLTMEILGCSEQRETVCKCKASPQSSQHEDKVLDVQSPGVRIASGKESEAPVPPCSTVQERPLEQILRDLQLSDDTFSSSTNAIAHTADLDPRDRAISKSFISTGREAPEEEYTEGSYIQVANTPPNEQELLDEAAGGSEAGNSTIGFEVFLNSMEDESDVGFAVMPLSWCPHLGSVCAVPQDGVDVRQPCAQCGSELENWLCLTCYQVLCGRYVSQHMLSHGLASGHHLVLSFSDLSVWCYGCESYIHNQALFPAKSAAYSSKFGE